MSPISSWRLAGGKLPGVRLLLDLRLQVVLLAWLFVLVGWGTLYQVDQGLWAAQQRFFYSWFFWVAGFLPLPGAKLTLAILTVTLLASMALRLPLTRAKGGLWLIHLGLAVLLIGGAISHGLGRESFLALTPGQGSDKSEDWREWEIAITDKESGKRTVKAVTLTGLPLGRPNDLKPWPLSFQLKKSWPHAARDMAGALSPLPRENDPSRNLPAVQIAVSHLGSNQIVELWAADEHPVRLGEYHLMLRRLRHPLPAVVVLKEFIKEEHPGTQVARRFESRVSLMENGVWRDARIFMNNPLHIGGTTFFQASYSENGPTRTSVLAVSQDRARFLPYLASGLVFLGLLYHFVMMLGRRLKRLAP